MRMGGRGGGCCCRQLHGANRSDPGAKAARAVAAASRVPAASHITAKPRIGAVDACAGEGAAERARTHPAWSEERSTDSTLSALSCDSAPIGSWWSAVCEVEWA